MDVIRPLKEFTHLVYSESRDQEVEYTDVPERSKNGVLLLGLRFELCKCSNLVSLGTNIFITMG